MVPFGEDVVVLAALRLRLSVFSWVDADAGESADKRLLQRAMPGRGVLHVVETYEHTVCGARVGFARSSAACWRGGAPLLDPRARTRWR